MTPTTHRPLLGDTTGKRAREGARKRESGGQGVMVTRRERREKRDSGGEKGEGEKRETARA